MGEKSTSLHPYGESRTPTVDALRILSSQNPINSQTIGPEAERKANIQLHKLLGMTPEEVTKFMDAHI